MRRLFPQAGAALAAVLAFAATMAAAETPVLEVPVDCAMGSACFVQNYFDHDPGPGFADHTCGPLGYDGHDGIDFRARTLAQMRSGIAILAAAPGVVVGTRNEMDDVSVAEIGREALGGRDAGNGVRIDHGGGWFTQYSHMMQGSVRVRVGDRVEAGQPLGLMGLSGNTEFPHLHFSVERDGVEIDPYVGADATFACGDPGAPLWSASARDALAYVAGAALAAGFAGEAADDRTAAEGGYETFSLAPGTPALVFWAEFFGVRAGDRIRLLLELPGDGIDDVEHVQAVEQDRAREFRFAGRRQPDGGWPSGLYRGSAELIREIGGAATVVSRIERSLELP